MCYVLCVLCLLFSVSCYVSYEMYFVLCLMFTLLAFVHSQFGMETRLNPDFGFGVGV